MPNNSPKSFSTEITVIFRDVDAMGHVNNAVYFTYMETARTNFFMNELGLSTPGELPLIVAQASCTYRMAARFGDRLITTVFVSRIGIKSFDLDYRITTLKGDPIADGKTVMVTYDYISKVATKIPPALREVIQKYHREG